MQASRAMSSKLTVTVASRAAGPSGAFGGRLHHGAALAIGVAATALVLASVALERTFAPGHGVAWRATVAAVVGGALLLGLTARHLESPAFGLANGVTLGRGVLTLLLAAFLGVQGGAPIGWLLVALAIAAVALDGVDGRLARRRNEASAFGARFDMETDALLILVLAALVWRLDKAGAWILAAGLLRYLFVLASYVRPWLDRPLPPSRRRQTVCVLQIVSLIGALVPGVMPPWSVAIALAGLVVLVWSFAVDVVWLARRAHR
jgi:phosphatidylglycerophosphate synthase